MSDKTMYEAFHEAYAEMSNPKKNAANPAFRSKYANLEELLNVTRPILAALGFAIIQEPVSDNGSIGVHTRLIHKSGEQMDFGAYTVPLTKHDAQGAGSAITYCRRYALAAIFGLAQEDDDGNAASGGSHAPAAASKPQGVASENQVKAVWGKASALSMSKEKLYSAIKRDFPGKDHPDQLTSSEARTLLGKMQKAIDAQDGGDA